MNLQLLVFFLVFWKGSPVHVNPDPSNYWELKTKTGKSYSPIRHAISLKDHSIAFSSSAYCVDHATEPPTLNGSRRVLCEQCPTCAWELRQGFRTEAEWQSVVTMELARLEGGGGPSSQGKKEGGEEEEERLGSWIVEAPISMKLSPVSVDTLGTSTGVSLHHIVIAGDRRYFVVAATPTRVVRLLEAGFRTATPIPPRLKVDPLLELASSSSSYITAGAADDEDDGGEKVNSLTGGIALCAEIARHTNSHTLPTPQLLSSASSSYNNSSSSTHSTTSTPAAPPLRMASPLELSTMWTGTVARRVGHSNAQVLTTGGGDAVTIHGLNSVERYTVALVLAAHGEVEWVSHATPVRLSNYFAAKIVQKWPPLENKKQQRGAAQLTATNAFNVTGVSLEVGGLRKKKTSSPTSTENEQPWNSPLHDLGILGQSSVVGVADWGLDYTSCFFRDATETPMLTWSEDKRHRRRKRGVFETWKSQTHRKLRQYVAFGSHGASYDASHPYSNHGTHVCGSIAGDPAEDKNLDDMTGKMYGGVAPAAKIAFFDMRPPPAITDYDRFWSPIMEDIARTLFLPAYQVGARVYSISFGGISMSGYTRESQALDRFSYKNQDFLAFAAAGNDGVPDIYSWKLGNICPPATAKNAVAVGSHKNIEMSKLNAGKQRWIAGLSKFSSRGPTMDGRIKPDVIGPGDTITSACAGDSSLNPGTCSVVAAQGTSSSTPIMAGAAVLVREYFTKGYYPGGVKDPKNEFVPMGALLKAILVNSGRPLLTSPDGKIRPKSRPIHQLPNNDVGWGGVDLSTTIVTPSSPQGLALKVYGDWSKQCAACPVVYAGETVQYDIKINKKNRGNLPLKVTLVWFDKEASLTAMDLTINDLDLSLVARNKRSDTFYPNGASSGPDEINNVEHIAIPQPTPGGHYKVVVGGTRVPLQYQHYALVISGPFDASKVKEKLGTAHPDRPLPPPPPTKRTGPFSFLPKKKGGGRSGSS